MHSIVTRLPLISSVQRISISSRTPYIYILVCNYVKINVFFSCDIFKLLHGGEAALRKHLRKTDKVNLKMRIESQPTTHCEYKCYIQK